MFSCAFYGIWGRLCTFMPGVEMCTFESAMLGVCTCVPAMLGVWTFVPVMLGVCTFVNAMLRLWTFVTAMLGVWTFVTDMLGVWTFVTDMLECEHLWQLCYMGKGLSICTCHDRGNYISICYVSWGRSEYIVSAILGVYICIYYVGVYTFVYTIIWCIHLNLLS